MTFKASQFLPGIRQDVVPCALVLEDTPTQSSDGRLDFESFQGSLDQAYNVDGYREVNGARMPQPGTAQYRGGNWSTLSIELHFRAGRTLTRITDLDRVANVDLDNLLAEMEHKVRWCEALTFPQEREASAYADNAFKQRQRDIGRTEDQLESLGEAGKRYDPPIVLVVFGSFLIIRGYVTAVSIKWEGPFHPITAQPFGAQVTLSVQRLDRDMPTWKSIRNQANVLPGAAVRIAASAVIDPGAIATRVALDRAIAIRRASINAGNAGAAG